MDQIWNDMGIFTKLTDFNQPNSIGISNKTIIISHFINKEEEEEEQQQKETQKPSKMFFSQLLFEFKMYLFHLELLNTLLRFVSFCRWV